MDINHSTIHLKTATGTMQRKNAIRVGQCAGSRSARLLALRARLATLDDLGACILVTGSLTLANPSARSASIRRTSRARSSSYASSAKACEGVPLPSSAKPLAVLFLKSRRLPSGVAAGGALETAAASSAWRDALATEGKADLNGEWVGSVGADLGQSHL